MRGANERPLSVHRYIAPSWDKIYSMLGRLALRIQESGFKPDLIVAISRGGWAPARVLSDFLGNLDMVDVKVQFYVGIAKTARSPVITKPLSEDIANKKILLVDDVADSGRSLDLAFKYLLERGASAVKTVTLYFKPASIIKPDFFEEETPDWIIFPWERFEVVKLLAEDARSRGNGLEAVKNTLRESGIDDSTLAMLLAMLQAG